MSLLFAHQTILKTYITYSVFQKFHHFNLLFFAFREQLNLFHETTFRTVGHSDEFPQFPFQCSDIHNMNFPMVLRSNDVHNNECQPKIS